MDCRGVFPVAGSAWAGIPATLSAIRFDCQKTSPRTLPRAWSQLLPPRREATKLDIFLRLAGRTLSRAPQVVPRYALTVKAVSGYPMRLPAPRSCGEGSLSTTLTAPSIHVSCQRSSRAKSFFQRMLQRFITRTKVVGQWHQEAILRGVRRCYARKVPGPKRYLHAFSLANPRRRPLWGIRS
jgi:hypothetical protein